MAVNQQIDKLNWPIWGQCPFIAFRVLLGRWGMTLRKKKRGHSQMPPSDINSSHFHSIHSNCLLFQISILDRVLVLYPFLPMPQIFIHSIQFHNKKNPLEGIAGWMDGQRICGLRQFGHFLGKRRFAKIGGNLRQTKRDEADPNVEVGYWTNWLEGGLVDVAHRTLVHFLCQNPQTFLPPPFPFCHSSIRPRLEHFYDVPSTLLNK